MTFPWLDWSTFCKWLIVEGRRGELEERNRKEGEIRQKNYKSYNADWYILSLVRTTQALSSPQVSSIDDYIYIYI